MPNTPMPSFEDRDMRFLVFSIGPLLARSAEIPPLVRRSSLFDVQGAKGEAANGAAGSSGNAPSYYADFELGCVTAGDVTDLSESLIFESAEDCCGVM